MKISIISGSQRQQSQSSKVARYLQTRTDSLLACESFLFELGGNPLPLWDEEIWTKDSHWQHSWQPVAKEFQDSDGFVWVVPEWNGMVPPAIINLLHLCSHKEVGHKPALIVTVSASRNGAYPVSLLRQATTKNNRMLYIPEHIIVRDVERMLNGDEPKTQDEEYLIKRIDYAVNILGSYTTALQKVRSAGIIDHQTFANGM